MKRKSTATLHLVTDPVCKMEFSADEAAATLKYNRRMYYFCHVACLRVFEADPLAYVGDAQAEGKVHAKRADG